MLETKLREADKTNAYRQYLLHLVTRNRHVLPRFTDAKWDKFREYWDKLTFSELDLTKNRLIGQYFRHLARIEVEKTLSRAKKRFIYLHEITHAWQHLEGRISEREVDLSEYLLSTPRRKQLYRALPIEYEANLTAINILRSEQGRVLK